MFKLYQVNLYKFDLSTVMRCHGMTLNVDLRKN